MIGQMMSNPLVFATAAALLAAVLTFGYLKTVEPDDAKVQKATFKVFLVVFVANLVLLLLVNQREKVATVPWDVDM